MYRVLKPFTDLKDGNRKYQQGDTYPRAGLKVRASRVWELQQAKYISKANKAVGGRETDGDTN